MKRLMWFQNKKSQALILVVIILGVALALGTGLLFQTRSQQETIGLHTRKDRAYSLARSGIEIARSKMNATGDLAKRNYNFGIGIGNATIEATAGAITSIGRTKGAVQVLAKTVPIVSAPPDPPPPSTSWAKGYSIDGQGGTDSNYVGTRNGGFWLAGDTNNGTDYDWHVLKLLPGGLPDNSFGQNSNGIMTFEGAEGEWFGRGFSATPDATSGGFIIGGQSDSFSTSGKAGKSGIDMLAIKVDDNEAIEWKMVYRGSNDDYLDVVLPVVNSGSIDAYILGGQSGSWTGSDNDPGSFLLKVSPTDGALMTGAFGTTGIRHYAHAGGEGMDFNFVRRTDDNGYVIGVRLYQSSSYHDFLTIKVDSQGNLADGAGDCGTGAECWAIRYGQQNIVDWPMDIIATSDGGYLAVGFTKVDGDEKGLMIKTNNVGTVIWAKTYDETTSEPGFDSSDRLNAVREVSGGYIVAGVSFFQSGAGNGEWLIIKTDPNGVKEWAKVCGSADMSSNSNEIAFSIDETTDGGYIISGQSGSWGGGSKNALVVKIGADGEMSGSDEPGTSPDLNYRDASISGDQTDRAGDFTVLDITADISDAEVILASEESNPAIVLGGPSNTTIPIWNEN